MTSNSSSILLQRVTEAEHQLRAVHSRLASNTEDLATLGESVGNCLLAARADAAAMAPSSYLSTLLAPAGAGVAAAQLHRPTVRGSTGRRSAEVTTWVGAYSVLCNRCTGTERSLGLAQCLKLQQVVQRQPSERVAERETVC